MKLTSGNMTLALNIFYLQRQPSSFDDIEAFTLKWVEDSIFDDEFDNMFAAKYEYFLTDDESEYDMFEFNDLCSAAECLTASTFESNFSPASLELKPLFDSLIFIFGT